MCVRSLPGAHALDTAVQASCDAALFELSVPSAFPFLFAAAPPSHRLPDHGWSRSRLSGRGERSKR
jgi:hypothetical protein